ncbi:hypothetical protein MKX01_031696 [Papaver californicum]|nr:hypothetical protein MKX01_031696 [Papaver californicum]
MATKTKNVALVYLMLILVSMVAFQVCKADDDDDEDHDNKGEVYQQCFKECDDKCKADGYGEIFCHAKYNVNQHFIAVKDTATFIHKSISKATTCRMQSTDAGLVALLGTFILALYH